MKRVISLVPGNLLAVIAFATIAYSAYLALAFSGQPPLDVHSFRQTQTALTAYWFSVDGFKFAYETPVAGAPWSIPFEFPIYQLLVANISDILGASLDITGRIISYIFLILCLVPVRSITQKLMLPASVFLIFSAILFSAPLYVYWGRTFMIETAALFFVIVSIRYFINALYDGFTFKTVSLFVLFVTLSVLQKATTALPVLALLSFVYLYYQVKKSGSIGDLLSSKNIMVAFACFVVPLAIGYVWVAYTDHIKSLNPLGLQLTSSALSSWNWGALSQRFSSDLYIKVLWVRIFVTNIAGLLGLSLLLFASFARCEIRVKVIIFLSVTLGVLPLLLFANLHIIHDYYQTATVIFLIYAVAVSLGSVILPAYGHRVTIALLVLIVGSNVHALSRGYLGSITTKFDKTNRDVAVGQILKREVPEGGQFVAFGNDWSSTFAYISQRKSFTVPPWFREYDQVKSKPEDYVQDDRLGAVVSCSDTALSFTELFIWADERDWKIGETNGCYLATPEKIFDVGNIDQAECKGSIDIAAIENRSEQKVISLAGWSTISGSTGEIPEHVFVTLSQSGKSPIYLETLKVPRLDVSAHLGISTELDAGFSRVIPANIDTGEYVVGIIQSSGDKKERCQYQKRLTVEVEQ